MHLFLLRAAVHHIPACVSLLVYYNKKGHTWKTWPCTQKQTCKAGEAFHCTKIKIQFTLIQFPTFSQELRAQRCIKHPSDSFHNSGACKIMNDRCNFSSETAFDGFRIRKGVFSLGNLFFFFTPQLNGAESQAHWRAAHLFFPFNPLPTMHLAWHFTTNPACRCSLECLCQFGPVFQSLKCNLLLRTIAQWWR